MSIEPKQLSYNGNYGKDENPMPKINYNNIPKKQRKQLRKKMLYEVSEEEFEEWLAVEMFHYSRETQSVYSFDLEEDDNAKLCEVAEVLPTEEDKKCHAAYLRTEFYHMKESDKWEKKHLDPLVKELAKMERNDPQYDYSFLYKLERQKLICMDKYLSHSRIADSVGHYHGKKWLLLSISLLDYIVKEKEVSSEQIKKMNIKNIRSLHINDMIERYKDEKMRGLKECEEYLGSEIYRRKIARLYHLIRLYKTHEWWE